jgi:phytanoyl-CoA hydroxylase
MLSGGGLTRDCTQFALHTKRRWLAANYEAGDVVFHQCRMIHCSANNEDPDERIRFATDVRFTDKQMMFEDCWDDYGEDEV